MKVSNVSPYIVPLVLLSLYIRICISFAPHSGYNNAPKFGDYEAQRHWQEVTVNLPVSEWYKESSANNLSYWGLDYPPLTAFHSQVVGHVAQVVNSSWVQLHTSRGEESYAHKVFMRTSVLVAELVHIPPLFLLAPSSNLPALILLSVTPSQPLIDHGHFQYNCVSLGFTLFAVFALRKGWLCSGSALFTLALNYKQMSLYHALPFFFYILGPRYNSWAGFRQIVTVGGTVVLTFALCWSPFLSTADHVVFRMFPFNRGLFEDKVATFWCSLSVLLKVRDLVDRVLLVRAALFFTLVAVLPSQILLFRNATPHKFILALTNSALGFFLFSFHVHEKTILIPLTTAVLLLFAEKNQPKSRLDVLLNKQRGTQTVSLSAAWFIFIATFSMYPLLQRDGLGVMYITGMGLYLSVLHVVLRNEDHSKPLLGLFWLSVAGCILLHLGEVLLPPTDRYPFIHPTLNALYSAAHFAGFFCYFNYRQIFDR